MNPCWIADVLSGLLDSQVTERPAGPGPSGAADVDCWLDVWAEESRHVLAVAARASLGGAGDQLVEWQRRLRRAQPGVVPLFVAPRLAADARRQLRGLGVNHADLRGHLWIRHPGLIVMVEGGVGVPRPAQPRSSPNPFSRKASLVLRALLNHPSRGWGVRELADEAGLSPGYTSDLLKRLVSEGLAEQRPDGHRIGDAATVLLRWAGHYRWDDNKLHSFVAPYGKDDLERVVEKALGPPAPRPARTLLGALDRLLPHIRHDQVHLYVQDLNPPTAQVLRERVYAEPVKHGGNLHILVPYYGQAAFYGARDLGGSLVVSDVQLFLDLVHYPLRGVEAADMLLRRVLAPHLDLDHSSVERLRIGLGLA